MVLLVQESIPYVFTDIDIGKIVFAGKDASRALAKSTTDTNEVRPEWSDLTPEQKKVLDDWITFFSKRYNVVGVVEGATNME